MIGILSSGHKAERASKMLSLTDAFEMHAAAQAAEHSHTWKPCSLVLFTYIHLVCYEHSVEPSWAGLHGEYLCFRMRVAAQVAKRSQA